MLVIRFKNKNMSLHRKNKPSIICSDGYIAYSLDRKLHREDGPAVTYPDGQKYYFLNDKEYSEEKYYKKLNLNK